MGCGLVVRLPGATPYLCANPALLPVGGGQGDRDPGAAPRACGAAPPAPTVPPATHRPRTAGGAQPGPPTGALVGVPGTTRDAAALARPHGPAALDLPDHLHRPAADLRSRAAAGRAPCPREPAVATSVSTASCCALAFGCRPARSGECCAPMALTRRRDAPRRAGGRSCVSRPPGSSRATSSPSILSGCAGCMCCSSSNLAAGGCILVASPTIPRDCGLPSRLAICWSILAIRLRRGSS